MFRVNEAPNTVLSCFDQNQKARDQGYFWSVLCCLPTCGFTIGWHDSKHDLPWQGCCYPAPVSLESDISYDDLIAAINKIRIIGQDLIVFQKKLPKEQRQVIAWQVQESIRLVNQAILDGVIAGSYLEALHDAHQALTRKAQIKPTETTALMTPEKTPSPGTMRL